MRPNIGHQRPRIVGVEGGEIGGRLDSDLGELRLKLSSGTIIRYRSLEPAHNRIDLSA